MRVLVTAPLVALLLIPGAGTSATAAEPEPCGPTPPDQRTVATGRGSLATLLRLDEVHRIATGEGVGVAVVDSGVSPGAEDAGSIDLAGGSTLAGGTAIHDTHGALVASLIAGERGPTPLGVAPDAEIWSYKVYDAGPMVADREAGWVGVEAGPVAAGVRAAAGNPAVDVILLALNFDEPAPVLTSAIRSALARGKVVVSSVGNREIDAESGVVDKDDAYKVGEERVRFPATVPGVLGVSSAGADGRLDPQYAYTGDGLDVTAPVGGVLAVTVGGSVCAIDTPWSSWGAAEVAGLAALLLEDGRFAPREVVARIEATAQGAVDSDALDGHGLIQPVEALTAELRLTRDGRVVMPEPARQPRRDVEPADLDRDEFADSRRALVWWGLAAGGALVAALLLRPLTARRSR